MFSKVHKKFKKIDVVINNAGINITNEFDKISEKDWDLVLDTNLKGVFLLPSRNKVHENKRQNY